MRRSSGRSAVGLSGCRSRYGIAVEIGIEPTARHAIDLGFIPIVVEDACGYGDEAAARRAFEQLRFGGDAILTTVDTIIRSFARA